MPQLLIASNNLGKVREFRELLAGCGWDVVGPADVDVAIEVEETGSNYHENAHIKAEAFMRASGIAALADDSGLEVDALGGEPGALHHVRGWDGADNDERIRILLNALKDVPPAQRRALYRAVIVVAVPGGGGTLESEGSCEGVIVDEAAGDNGFGYDPVFFLPLRGKTMAQLTAQEKNLISHRGVAAREIRERLRGLASNP